MNLHDAATYNDADDVAARAAEASDVDEFHEERTALWCAVFANKPDNARVLLAAGADPHRSMMSGWSPARLAAAGPTPDLFGPPVELSASEQETVTEARRLVAVLGDYEVEGLGLACVAGIAVAEATRRLGATACEEDYDDIDVVGVTDVSGGVIVVQPMGYRPQDTDVQKRLSVGTICYGVYENPKSGTQGSISRNGEMTDWDQWPGGPPREDEPILLAYLTQYNSVAYMCAYTGLRPTDARAVTGQPDMWLRVPNKLD
jgi:hypothetical protein